MQAPAPHATVDRLAAQTERHQLPACDDAVLGVRERRDPRVIGDLTSHTDVKSPAQRCSPPQTAGTGSISVWRRATAITVPIEPIPPATRNAVGQPGPSTIAPASAEPTAIPPTNAVTGHV